jgi:hypothetical protein
MFACPSGNVFIGLLTQLGNERMLITYICNALGRYIKTIGIDNIVQICIDNASSMRIVANLLIYHFPSLYFHGCATHCLNLLLEGWGKTTWTKKIVKKVKAVFFSHNNTMDH